LSYLAAFAEAAVVGALADWFAVVALFRYPMGIKLPHTAVIKNNKGRIAENLGDFIQGKFLATDKLLAVIKEFDPARKMASWLSSPDNTEKVGNYAVRALSFVIHSLDDAQVRTFLRGYVSTQLKEIDLVRPTGKLLDILAENRRYQGLLDQALEKIYQMLAHENVKEDLVNKIADAIPGKALLEVTGLDKKTAEFVLKRLLSALENLILSVRQDPDHPLRIRFDKAIAELSDKLKNDTAFGEKVRSLQREMAEHPEVVKYFQGLWSDFKIWLDADLARDDSVIREKIVNMARSFGQSLAADRPMQSWINEQILRNAPPIIEEYRFKIGAFIAQQVKSWNDDYMVGQLELNIGRDLQFIRLNGTLVGGLVGLTLYSGTHLMTSL
jgi:uncharacterized membrane-anchored protein YjiN (DUF445 family)